MNFKTLVTAAVAMSLGIGGLAFGQRNDDRNDDRNQRHQRGDRNERGDRIERNDRWRAEPAQRGGPRDRHDHYGARPAYRAQPQWQDNGHWRRDGRGAGPGHTIYRGNRLPIEYRSRQYVVDDWRSHRLYAPPRGYHWVQAGSDYVLVAIATGIILQLLLAN